jgi:hypothetical protein
MRDAILSTRAARSGVKTSRYLGVALHSGRDKKYDAFVKVKGKRIHLGLWREERGAAVARDRGALFFGLDTRLNVGTISRSLGPGSPEELCLLARQSGKEEASATPYVGVTWDPNGRCWTASICIRGRKILLISRFDSQEEAAVAYDRVALWMFGSSRPLNFPDRQPQPASLEEVRACARQLQTRRKRVLGDVGRADLPET